MTLNKSKGNMYDFVSHTWNTVKGACPHDCSYCYMKRFGKLNQPRLDEKEFRTDLGSGNFIFVGSSCDMFANGIPWSWAERTLAHCDQFRNQYLFQSKNPAGFSEHMIPPRSFLCTTIESNRFYPEVMCQSPHPIERARAMELLHVKGFLNYVTIEPILDFDLEEMVQMIRMCNPHQVSIGADSGGNGLPEPSPEKLKALIERIQEHTEINNKKNLKRLFKE